MKARKLDTVTKLGTPTATRQDRPADPDVRLPKRSCEKSMMKRFDISSLPKTRPWNPDCIDKRTARKKDRLIRNTVATSVR